MTELALAPGVLHQGMTFWVDLRSLIELGNVLEDTAAEQLGQHSGCIAKISCMLRLLTWRKLFKGHVAL